MRSTTHCSRTCLGTTTGYALLLLSLMATGAALAAPGLGWLFGMLVLTASSMLVQWIGKGTAGAVLAITVLHAVMLGPLPAVWSHRSVAAIHGWFSVLSMLPFALSIARLARPQPSDGEPQPAQPVSRHRP